MNTGKWLLILLALAMVLPPSRASACNVPVFRYALERWRADRDEDRYHAVVFHRGPLPPGQAKAVAALRASAERQGAPANLLTETADLAGPADEALAKLWK